MSDGGRRMSTTFTRYKHKISTDELGMLSQKLEENPENFDLMDWAAFAYYSHGDMPKAIGYYERLVRRFPENASYHYYLGNAHHRQGATEAAHNHWRRVTQLDTTGNFSDRAQRKLQNLEKDP